MGPFTAWRKERNFRHSARPKSHRDDVARTLKQLAHCPLHIFRWKSSNHRMQSDGQFIRSTRRSDLLAFLIHSFIHSWKRSKSSYEKSASQLIGRCGQLGQGLRLNENRVRTGDRERSGESNQIFSNCCLTVQFCLKFLQCQLIQRSGDLILDEVQRKNEQNKASPTPDARALPNADTEILAAGTPPKRTLDLSSGDLLWVNELLATALWRLSVFI